MRSPPGWLQSIAVLFVMRVCMSVNFNALRNTKSTEYTWSEETQTCVYQKQSKGELYAFIIPFYVAEFFLPALGGLAVDKWFGELRLLRVAGVLLFLSAIYWTAVEMGQLLCRPGAYIIGMIPCCLAYGVGMAPLASSPQKLAHGHFGSPTPGLVAYYSSAALGEFIGFLPQYLRPTVDVTWILCVSAILYIAASSALKLDWTEYRQRFHHQLEDGFMLPTRARFIRYFVLLAPLIMLVSVIADVRGITYCLELNYYLNCTGNCTTVTCAEVFSGYNVSTMLTMLFIAVLYKTGCLTMDGRISARFYSGVIILMLGKAAMIPWHSWAAAQPHQPDPSLTHIVYGSASVLDGLANGLALASGYEMVYRIAPAHSKSFIMGFLFTIWGVGAGISGLFLMVLISYPQDHPVLKPIFGEWNKLYTMYVVMVVELMLTLLYYVSFSARLAPSMIVSDDYEEIGDDDTMGATPSAVYRPLVEDVNSEKAYGSAGSTNFT